MGDRPYKFFFLIFCLVVLSSCLSMHDMDKQLFKKCIQQCQKKMHNCLMICQNNCENCVNSSNVTTENSYTRYINEQKIQGIGVIRQLNSYRDPLQCRKHTCNCNLDYKFCSNLCYSPQH